MYRVKIIDIEIFLLVAKNCLGLTKITVIPDWVDVLLTAIILGIFIIDCANQKYTPFKLLTYLLCSILCVYSGRKSGDMLIANTMITCMIIHRFDIKDITKRLYKWNCAYIFLHMTLAIILGLLGMITISSYHNSRYRFDFGFTHANTLGMFVMNLIMLYTWNNWEKLTYKRIGYLLLIGLITFLFTNSRTELIAILIYVVVLLSCKWRRKAQKIIRLIAMFITPVMGIITLSLCYLYSRENIVALIVNKLLNSRIMLGSYMITHFSPSLLGQNANSEVAWDQFYGIRSTRFDCSYSYLLISGGFIWLIIIVWVFYFAAREMDTRVHVAIIVFAFYAVSEINVLNGIKFFPILILTYIFGKVSRRPLCKSPDIFDLKSKE